MEKWKEVLQEGLGGEQGAVSTAESSRDNLASLYRPPFHLMFTGTFDKAKTTASSEDKWLLVNIQSTKEFNSHMVLDYIIGMLSLMSGADSANPKPLDDDDNVELEKRKTLLAKTLAQFVNVPFVIAIADETTLTQASILSLMM
ncbi:hypothetical protein K1719_012764 [Acacia pycnantha]|nr:hypothetical protein K1719_012764 [Acacia pycnantha]